MSETLGQIISRERKKVARFKTKKALADAVGVSLEYIRKIEADQGKPSGKLLERIIFELDMPEKCARKCWQLLAELQLDDITLQHIRISEARGKLYNGVAEKAAKIASRWIGDLYDLDNEDAEVLKEEIIQQLRK
jgi:transcriptional regulator with XRE-family HTH domain